MNNNNNRISNHYKIIQHNIRSITANKEELENYITKHDIDIIMLSETWLREQNYIKKKNYTLETTYSITGYRGVGIAIKDTIKYKNCTFPHQLNTIEVQCLEILEEKIKNISIYIPEGNNQEIKDDWEKILDYSRNEKVIIGGDFNAHSRIWGSSKSDRRGNLIIEALNNHNMIIMNIDKKKRTRINNGDSELISAIDLTIISANIYSKI
jgi:exonuclease III